jgi:GDPmannose 4,6-dehydratase
MDVLVTGIGGQDGYYLSELLLRQGRTVCGIYRSDHSVHVLEALSNQYGQSLNLIRGDAMDPAFLRRLIIEINPHYIYNLAAQSRVGESFRFPVQTIQVNAMVPLSILETIRECNPKIRFFQACSSEIFGECPPVPQNEATPLAPLSPYAVSKASAYWLVKTYRRAFDLFACNAILYNHESPLRDQSFLSGKVVRAVAEILKGKQQILTLGNLDVKRDWGFAGDYVEAMSLMMDQPEAHDYIIATGETHSVGEFVEIAFAHVGLDWQKYVQVDEKLLRPVDAHLMMGDATLARQTLGWRPRCDFRGLVALMVDAAVAQSTVATQVGQG